MVLILAETKCQAFEPFRCPEDGRCISIQYLCDGAPDWYVFEKILFLKSIDECAK